ncbi:hypothetical protein KAH55_14060 [bacterium]|nr:hypothetical protein [bacterium]
MIESSQNLINMLHGQPHQRPPFWDPWFGMHEMLKNRYHNSYLEMAADLGHAAIPLSYLETNVLFQHIAEKTEAGAYYAGGELRDISQLAERPDPDFSAQLPAIQHRRNACTAAGRACWTTFTWCFHAAATSMGLEHFAIACYDQPDFIHEYMEWVERRNRAAIREIIAKVRPDFVLFDGDCAYKTGTMVQPEMMREFCLEPTRKTMALLAELGIPAVFHSDGKIDQVIPLLLELGFRAVHGCEKQANDLNHLVTTFGNDIILCGNMDIGFLSTASPEEVSETTTEMLRIGSQNGRFFAGCNTSPQDYIPFENYQAMARAIQNFSG